VVTGLRKQSPPLYPKMRSFSGAFRQFSTFEKLASEAVPEIVCSARQNDLHFKDGFIQSREGISPERAPERVWNVHASEDRRRKLSTISGVSEGDIPGSDRKLFAPPATYPGIGKNDYPYPRLF
jgi:hypothetical protein